MKTTIHYSMHTESFGGEPGEATGNEEVTNEANTDKEAPKKEIMDEDFEEEKPASETEEDQN